MKTAKSLMMAALIFLCLAGCTPLDHSSSAADSRLISSAAPDVSQEGSSLQNESGTLESAASIADSTVTVAMIDGAKTLSPFDMRANDTAHGWTLTEIEPWDTPPDAKFYGFLTFTGEVTITGTVTHVNALYDGFELIPDAESMKKLLIPDGNPDKAFSLSLVNHSEPQISEVLSQLVIDESGEYTVTITQYSLAYVPMMATNNATISLIEKK